MTWILLLALTCALSNDAAASGEPPDLGNWTLRASVPAKVDEAIGNARKRFTAEVTNGHLKTFDEQRAQVVFRATEKDDSSHRPGPMEDEVIAATLRSHIAGDSALQNVGIKIRSEAGRVQLSGAPENPDALAKLIVLAFNIDGVSGVRADLPRALRAKS